MDENVLAAMQRWPDVPDVFGWLSLSVQGQWRLHPNGTALARSPQPQRVVGADDGAKRPDAGEPIGSAQIAQFIDRNYASDEQGRWYFQNGPQRVFVRLDAAPYIVHTTQAQPPWLMQTHNGLEVKSIGRWWLDDMGWLYALTEHGPALIAGRDAMAVIDSLYTLQNQPLTAALERDPKPAKALTLRPSALGGGAHDKPASAESPLLLCFCQQADIPTKLGFIPWPGAL